VGPRGPVQEQEKRTAQTYGMISDGGFPKKEHILKTKDFKAAYKTGRYSKRGGLVFYSAPNSLDHNRLGFSISSSVVALASLRNRIKRLMREAYRHNRVALKPGHDIVLVVRKEPGKNISYEWAEKTFLSLAKEAGIMI